MDLSSFITSLTTSFLIFVLLMLLFTWLSGKPGNEFVYYPNRILKGLDPIEGGYASRNPFAWAREALSSTENDIISMSGIDTAVYFVFLSTVLGILALSGVLLLPVLLPLAATDKSRKTSNQATSNGAFSNLDKLSMGNVGEKTDRLWAFFAGTYWVSFMAYYFLWKAYKHVSQLRARALESPEVKPEQFAVLVRDAPALPVGQTRKEQIDSYFRSIYPETFCRSMVITNNKKVNEIYEELKGYKKKLARAEAVYAVEGTRPTNGSGLLGLLGKRVDSIDYYTGKIDRIIPRLTAAQKATLRENQQAAALVFFTNRMAAASAAQNLHARFLDKWTVTDAPEPRQLIWSNLDIRFFERQVRQIAVYVVVALTILFYMVPIAFISAFTTLANLKKLLPFLKEVVDQPTIKTILEAYLPQMALIVFLALLPELLLFLSRSEGIPSQSHVERAASGKYFYFSVLNVFIGVTVGGTLFSTLEEIEKDPNSIINLLARSLPRNATYFLTFVALKFFVGYGLELSRVVPLVIFHLKTKYMCKTQEEVKESWFPGDMGYATKAPTDMLILTIVLCYSIIAPLIIPFGVVYFALGWLVLRNQALKVYVPSYESYGRMWPHLHSRVVASLVLFQLTMLGYFGAKKFAYTLIVIPAIIFSLVFALVCHRKFYRFFQDTALEVAARGQNEPAPNMGQIFRCYLPPSLTHEKVDKDGQP
ncbi:hypothetical protein SAY86_006753 [Trapa natans]|uniref:CSC1-like protein ERD4 n=1 Tax=Trapa natans TaxID=22666 RepID=A0AAN7QX30_TRANT|nr:hypothetical protein SAY86_006753 [Trapa natans]